MVRVLSLWIYRDSETEYSSHFYCNTDIDECENDELNNCHEDANCTNTEGSFDCSCNDGYSGSGTECTGKKIATSSDISYTYTFLQEIDSMQHLVT